MHNDKNLCDNGKPEVIEFYNKTKCGVDTFDQMCSTYSCGRKTRRWPMCVFLTMVDTSALNAYIILSMNDKSYN